MSDCSLYVVVRDVRVNTFLSELEHRKKPAMFLLQKVPHILPHNEVSTVVVIAVVVLLVVLVV